MMTPRPDLHVDGVYEGGRLGNAGDDPVSRLVDVSVMGGFRYRGSLADLRLVVLTTTLDDADWPDNLDKETGVLTYYGDNKTPGRELHRTPRFGNEILRRVFDMADGDASARAKLPPILVFANTGTWRDVRFLGLAVPGASHVGAREDLVAIWRVSGGERFQNYRARLTILDVPTVRQQWLADVRAGESLAASAPPAWRRFVESGDRVPLLATPTLGYRRKHEQLPQDAEGVAIVRLIHAWFRDTPHAFEACAAALTRMMLPDITALDVTRPSRDGGRDAIGQLRLGLARTSISLDFAVEAKCYELSHSVGVREAARLISRLRYRQFGVLVTTSYVDSQAYQEIRADDHPIIVVAAADIVELLRGNGLGTRAAVSEWLVHAFPRSVTITRPGEAS